VADQVFEPIIPCLTRIVRPHLTLYRGVMNIPYGGRETRRLAADHCIFFDTSFAQMTRKKRRDGTSVEWKICWEGIIPR